MTATPNQLHDRRRRMQLDGSHVREFAIRDAARSLIDEPERHTYVDGLVYLPWSGPRRAIGYDSSPLDAGTSRYYKINVRLPELLLEDRIRLLLIEEQIRAQLDAYGI